MKLMKRATYTEKNLSLRRQEDDDLNSSLLEIRGKPSGVKGQNVRRLPQVPCLQDHPNVHGVIDP